jgi:hypothetical protein
MVQLPGDTVNAFAFDKEGSSNLFFLFHVKHPFPPISEVFSSIPDFPELVGVFSAVTRRSGVGAFYASIYISDLVNIAVWGGNQHDIASKVLAQNTGAHVQIQTRQAIGDLNKGNWANALQELKGVNSWGFTYATKTLRFICPQKYPALDRLIRSQIKVLNLKRNDASYRQFTKLCQQIRQRCSQPGPRSGDAWWLADVDMALFAFSRNGNCLV